MSWAPTALAVLAYSCFEVVRVGWSVGAGALRGVDRSGRTLALRVNAKLGTLSECIHLPRVHDELGGSQQTLQRRLGHIGRILLEGLFQIALEQSVGAIILARVIEVEYLFKFAEEQHLRLGWHVAKVRRDRDGRPHRLVQVVPLVQCCKRIALPESLKDDGDLPTRLPFRDWHTFHDFGGHEAQADRHDGLRVRQHRESLRIVHAGTNEELVILSTYRTVSHLTQTSFTTHSVQYTQYTLSVHILSSLHSVLMLHSCSKSSVNYNRTSHLQLSPC